MKRFVKAIVALLCLSMFFYVLSGCNRTEDDPAVTTAKSTLKTTLKETSKSETTSKISPAKTSTQTPGTSSNNNETDLEPEDLEPPETDGDENPDEDFFHSDDGPFAGLKFRTDNIDLGGKTLTLKSWNNWPANDDNPANVRFYKRMEKAEKLLNVKYNLVTVPGVDNYVKAAINDHLAGIVFSDEIYGTTVQLIPAFMKLGMGVPLDDYIDYDHPKWATAKAVYKYIDGKHYGMSSNIEIASWQTIYNDNIIKREGLTDILQLYNEGNWTWDTMLDYCIKSTRDTNGDGIIDQFGAATIMLSRMIHASNGAVKIGMDDNGFIFGLDTPESIKAFTFFRDLVFVYKIAHPTESFSNGNQLMTFGFSWNSSWFINYTNLKTAVLTAPLPAGPDRAGDVLMTDNVNMYMVNPLSEFTPEEIIVSYIMRLYNDPNDPECYQNAHDHYITKNRQYYSTDEEAEFWYLYSNNPSKAKVDYISGFTDANAIITNEIFPEITKGEFFATPLEKARPKVLEAINSAAY